MLFSSTIWPAKVVIIADTTKFAQRADKRLKVKERSAPRQNGMRMLTNL